MNGYVFDGLMPAMVTPFDERGDPDLDAAEALVDRFVEAGVDGISALGSTGEFSHLDSDERRRFTENLVEMVAGRVPLLIGVGTTGTREAIDLSRHAGAAGADGVLVVSPFYWNVGEEALYRHFAAVAQASRVPVLLYNFPLLTGLDLSPGLVARLAGEQANIVGIKDTVTENRHTLDVIEAVKGLRPEFTVLSGMEDQILPSVIAGGDGSICGLGNVAPELFVDLVKSARSGYLDRAADLHRRVLPLLALYTLSDPGMGAVKLAMKMLGFPITPTVRGPALPAPPEAEAGIEAALKEAGLFPVARGT